MQEIKSVVDSGNSGSLPLSPPSHLGSAQPVTSPYGRSEAQIDANYAIFTRLHRRQSRILLGANQTNRCGSRILCVIPSALQRSITLHPPHSRSTVKRPVRANPIRGTVDIAKWHNISAPTPWEKTIYDPFQDADIGSQFLCKRPETTTYEGHAGCCHTYMPPTSICFSRSRWQTTNSSMQFPSLPPTGTEQSV
ncbi:hypothetical protein V8C43DRAFT_317355 [Trichoderma afarasin]